MTNYRITFLKNEIISCRKMKEEIVQKEDSYRFEQSHGQMIFAIVNADNAKQARKIANDLAKRISKNKKNSNKK